MKDSKIEWTHHTFNPWIGCAKVSPGCANCYAEALMDTRWGKVRWGKDGTRVRASESYWREPAKWDAAARAAGERHRVFCASLADVFEQRPDLAPWRAELFRQIDATPNLDWMLLTKRPENIPGMWHSRTFRGEQGTAWGESTPTHVAFQRDNVWLGTSVENQKLGDERIKLLRACRGLSPVLFLSMEPLLGPVDLCRAGAIWTDPGLFEGLYGWVGGIDLVIVGGESGPGARPMHPHWPVELRDQCRRARIPFFFKQWGDWEPMMPAHEWVSALGDMEPEDLKVMFRGVSIVHYDGRVETPKPNLEAWEEWSRTTPEADEPERDPVVVHRVGKKVAGRLLEGQLHDEMPKAKGVAA